MKALYVVRDFKLSRIYSYRLLHSAYFNRGELWSSKVSPVLLAVGTLRVMIRSSPMTHWECYCQAAQLLEYIHSQCRRAVSRKEYYEMLIEVKTKVSRGLSQLVLWDTTVWLVNIHTSFSLHLSSPLLHIGCAV